MGCTGDMIVMVAMHQNKLSNYQGTKLVKQ
jgi:hypothetical protein